MSTELNRLNRREMLGTGAALATAWWVGTSTSSRAESPNDKLNIACIGIGGQGAANVSGVSSQNIVALCDVDDVSGCVA